MLSEQQIRELAVKMQTSFTNIAREYAQNLFLKHFYAHENSTLILFKGGTALRLLYGSPRFSEDLDFSTPVIRQKMIEDTIQETLLKIGEEGLQANVEESTVTTGGFLAVISLYAGGHKVNLSVEISGRKKRPTAQMILVDNPYIDAYTLMSLKREELITEKTEALLSRQKPRDFFDLYFMLRANLLPERSVLKKILPLVEETGIDFRRELDEFLPKSHRQIVRGFRMTLSSEIKRFL